ncbi:hypothetical protein HYV31_01005 [candidate division WWE3 bacterium]|nr:hypothetical protein [candidate division WWE3 bacterium]
MDYNDIRQSDNWSQYLQTYGWNSQRLSGGNVIRFNKFLFTKRASMQLPKPLNKTDLAEIERICRKNRALYLKITPNNTQDLDLLINSGYKKTNKIEIAPNTMLLDLTSQLEDIKKKFTGNCRYSIHNAEKDGCYTTIIKNPDKKDVEVFYKIMQERSRKKHFFIFGITDLLAKISSFGDQSFVCFVYNINNELLGAKMFLGFKETIYGIHSGTTEAGQKTNGGYKLLMDSIVYFKELGFETMDLGSVEDKRLKGLTHTWKNYSHYKYEFNGQIVYYNFPYIRWFW